MTPCPKKSGRSGTVREADTQSRITPLSHIINIILFAVFTLVSKRFAVVALQCLFLLLSFYMCGVRVRDIPLKQLSAVVPVIGFVLILNCFRGTGEILFSAGPFSVVKQGIIRGLFYTAVIIQLWTMSKLLTTGFSERQLLRSVSLFRRTPRTFGVFLVLYYILRIFHNTYIELKNLFTGSRKGIKDRTVRFLVHAFERAKEDFDRLEGGSLTEEGVHCTGNKSRLFRADLAYLSAQAGVLLLAFFMRDRFVSL